VTQHVSEHGSFVTAQCGAVESSEQKGAATEQPFWKTFGENETRASTPGEPPIPKTIDRTPLRGDPLRC
jgi:hypothetical protein